MFGLQESDMEEQKKQNIHEKLQHAISDMADNTAMHGLPNVKNRHSLWKKCFWLVIILCAFAILIWQIVKIVLKYYSYPVSTTTSLVFNPELTFPAITFCNLNPVRNASSSDMPLPIRMVMETSITGMRPPRPGATGSSTQYTEQRTDFSTFDTFYWNFMALNDTERTGAGHQIEDMLIDCSWRGKTCGPENFTHFNNWQYGNCYTFNAGIEQAAEVVRQPGPLEGLTLRLYVQSLEYVPSLSSSLGIKLVVHNQSAMPFPESEGILVQAGSFTQVGIKTTYISREDPPHGLCKNYTQAEANLASAYTEVLKSAGYTRQGCINTCKQTEIMMTCKCASTMYPITGKAYDGVPQDNKKRCQGETAKDCSDEQDHRANKKCTAPDICPDRCVDFQFPVTATSSRWPTDEEQTKALIDLADLAIEAGDQSLLEELLDVKNNPGRAQTFISQNVMVVQVFFEDLSYLSYSTDASFGIEDYLSSLGGCGGLWLGISVVTVFEIFEFIADLIGLCCGCKKRRKRVEDNDATAMGSM